MKFRKLCSYLLVPLKQGNASSTCIQNLTSLLASLEIHITSPNINDKPKSKTLLVETDHTLKVLKSTEFSKSTVSNILTKHKDVALIIKIQKSEKIF